ncbi:Xaa-Pro dipeptidyl-peptidase [Acrasis kona]|uniref:Xaa-Pro dipeptidyl-peptidase n=1 Tax=Acrasis kona TaxID=1008807 RepID=A0AAW2Z3W4_9EUKA
MNKLIIVLLVALLCQIFAEEIMIPVYKDTGYYWQVHPAPYPANYGFHQKADNYSMKTIVHTENAQIFSSYDLSQLQGKHVIKAEFDMSKLLTSTDYGSQIPNAEYRFPITQVSDFPVESNNKQSDIITFNNLLGVVRVSCATLESVQALDVTNVVRALLSSRENRLNVNIQGARIFRPNEEGRGIEAPSEFAIAAKQRNPYSSFLKVLVSDSTSAPESTQTPATSSSPPSTTKPAAQNESGENLSREEQASGAGKVIAGAVGAAAIAAAVL